MSSKCSLTSYDDQNGQLRKVAEFVSWKGTIVKHNNVNSRRREWAVSHTTTERAGAKGNKKKRKFTEKKVKAFPLIEDKSSPPARSV